MNRIDLDNFYSDTFQLARTMVVKIEAIAKRDNEVLEKAGHTVLSDKRTWLYYMNMNGDYHETNELMTVVSLDTGETIPFTKEVLSKHLLTYRQYLKGGSLYKRLVENYEGQSILINGILAPIDYSISIPAPNYKILSYSKTLVLWNEEQLIPAVQKWINGNAKNMFENEYHITEDLMMHQMVVDLYAGIIQCIGLTRFQAVKTRHAHDFYIWSHIDSYGEFSIYKNSLNLEQTMWLHDNIDYIMINAGKEFTFDRLVEKLLTLRNIPISSYEMVLNTENQLVDLTPTPQWKRSQLNMNDDKQIVPVYIATEKLIEKEVPMAVDNSLMTTIFNEEATYKGTNSLHTEVPTKVLESEMADYTNRQNDTMMTVVFNQWIYLAGKGAYQVNMAVVNPKDGRLLRLSAGDAFTLWRYITRLAHGDELLVIEDAFYHNVMKTLPPSVEELREVGLGEYYITDTVADSIRNQYVDVSVLSSAEELLTYSRAVYGAMWEHKKLYSQYGDIITNAAVKNACSHMYETGLIGLIEDRSYPAFLQKYVLEFDEYSGNELMDFAWVIFKTFTGWDLTNNPSLRSIQSDLIDLMMKLSSYTIQTVKTMDDGTDVIELPSDNRIGDLKYRGKGHEMVADLTKVQLAQSHALHMYASETLNVKLPNSDDLKLNSSAEVLVRFSDNTNCGLVYTKDDLDEMTYHIPSSDYLEVNLESLPVKELILPPTYYGDISPKSDDLVIPPTYYGQLGGEEESDMFIIPPTYYGQLVEDKTSGILFIPYTDYEHLDDGT